MKKWHLDRCRRYYLATAEVIDAFRIIPRLLLIAYMYLIYKVVLWFFDLAPYVIEGCTAEIAKECVAQFPTNAQAALITAVIGIGGAIFGLYSSSGRKWDGNFIPWNEKKEQGYHENQDDEQEPQSIDKGEK